MGDDSFYQQQVQPAARRCRSDFDDPEAFDQGLSGDEADPWTFGGTTAPPSEEDGMPELMSDDEPHAEDDAGNASHRPLVAGSEAHDEGGSEHGRQDEAAVVEFVPSRTFTGARLGWCFKKGWKGLGYYIDEPALPCGALCAMPPAGQRAAVTLALDALIPAGAGAVAEAAGQVDAGGGNDHNASANDGDAQVRPLGRRRGRRRKGGGADFAIPV